MDHRGEMKQNVCPRFTSHGQVNKLSATGLQSRLPKVSAPIQKVFGGTSRFNPEATTDGFSAREQVTTSRVRKVVYFGSHLPNRCVELPAPTHTAYPPKKGTSSASRYLLKYSLSAAVTTTFGSGMDTSGLSVAKRRGTCLLVPQPCVSRKACFSELRVATVCALVMCYYVGENGPTTTQVKPRGLGAHASGGPGHPGWPCKTALVVVSNVVVGCTDNTFSPTLTEHSHLNSPPVTQPRAQWLISVFVMWVLTQPAMIDVSVKGLAGYDN
ncbi:hypothetical protein Bbelb_435670 [Branchiostoma belcheri]|nr:hypothetical protein Bbelb_435670 [Branchiostoma belcheri]